MPPVLTKAHAALDSAVDKLYRKTAFPDDAARVALLFELYGKKTEGLLTGKRKRGRCRKHQYVAKNYLINKSVAYYFFSFSISSKSLCTLQNDADLSSSFLFLSSNFSTVLLLCIFRVFLGIKQLLQYIGVHKR